MKRIVVLLLSFALLAGSAAAAGADEWLQYRYDAAGSGANPNQSSIEANRWRVRWAKKDVDRIFNSDPLITEDAVYVAGRASGQFWLWKFDLQTGAIVWKKRATCAREPHIFMGEGWIVVVCDWTYFVNEDGRRFRRENPKRLQATMMDEHTAITVHHGTLHSFPMPGGEGPDLGAPFDPSLSDGNQPARIVDGEVWVVDGSVVPRFPALVSDGIALIPSGYAQGVPIDGSPVIHLGECPVAMPCAVDIATHEVLWTASTAGRDATVADGTVYGRCDSGTMCARDLHTGELLWESTVPFSMSVLAGGVLWVTGDVIIGLDPATGAIVSRRPFTQQFGPLGGIGPSGVYGLAIANGHMAIVGDGGLRVVTFDRA